MSYQILQDSTKEFSVPEYPTLSDERAFNRLLVKAGTRIVPQPQKEDICDKWGWDLEGVCSEEVSGHVEYHLELARVIFENGDELTEDDAESLQAGKIQEARTDFIQGCQGREPAQDGSSMQDAMSAVQSLIGQNGASTETESSPSTAGR